MIATGEMHAVREFFEVAFERAGWAHWEPYVEIDPRYFRPTEVDALQGDASKAKERLGWEPEVGFGELVGIMVDADIAELERAARGQGDPLQPRGHG